MLIPSIDLQGGRVVQLVQGERLAYATDDLDGWIAKFSRFPIVQLIDLDAARRVGSNSALVRDICARLPCQVGGGIRQPSDARALLDAGARRVIIGSALFDGNGVDIAAASAFSDAVGPTALIAAVDGRGGRVSVRGWQATLSLTVAEAIPALDPYVGGFLATLVDDEGGLGGVNIATATALRARTAKRLIIAGGIRSVEEITALDALGMDAVVGMAIYTGAIDTDALFPQ